jgi:hypothetical protein
VVFGGICLVSGGGDLWQALAMKKHRVIMVVVGCLVLASAAALFWPREREPRYNGRSLSELIGLHALDMYGSNDTRYGSAMEAGAAVRHIGTNALPYLMKWIRHQPPPWKRGFYTLLSRLPDSFIPSFMERDGDRVASAALEGFRILGAEASPTIPELMRMTKDGKTPANTLEGAQYALAFIGEDALGPVLAAVGDPNCPNREHFVWSIYLMGAYHRPTNGTAAVPVLIQCLKDKDLEVAAIASMSLGMLRLEPNLVVPALTECLQHPDARVRSAAAKSLGRFADQARSAVPSLLSALNDTNVLVSMTASNALYTIDPKALAKAGLAPVRESPR